MANYNSLKATVNANIKANNNQEITGPVLNSVLNQMINSLGAGYQYMGVATPTNPGTAQTPDYNCFYLATTPGTYTNLGGLVVADGEFAILKYNGSWTKDVTGAATSEEIYDINGRIGDSGEQSISANENFSFNLVKVIAGKSYTLNIKTSSGVINLVAITSNNESGGTRYLWGALDSGGRTIEFTAVETIVLQVWSAGAYVPNNTTIIWSIKEKVESGNAVLNVNSIEENNQPYSSPDSARAAVPEEFRKLGLQITYLLQSGWLTDQFIGSDISGWGNSSNWKNLSPINISKNVNTGHIDITFDGSTKSVASGEEIDNVVGELYDIKGRIGDSGEQSISANESFNFNLVKVIAGKSYTLNIKTTDNTINLVAITSNNESGGTRYFWDALDSGGRTIKFTAVETIVLQVWSAGAYVPNNTTIIWDIYETPENFTLINRAFSYGYLTNEGEFNPNPGFKSSPFVDISDCSKIKVDANYNNPGYNLIHFYDSNYNDISTTDVHSISVGETFDIPSGAKFVRYFMTTSDNPSMDLYGNTTNKKSNVIYVGQGVICDYYEIQDAIDNCNDSEDNPITIIVFPGIYKRFTMRKPDQATQTWVAMDRYISIIGIDKEICQVVSNTGNYWEAAGEIGTSGKIANLTFKQITDAEHFDPWESQYSAYAVHIDWQTNGRKEYFENCVFISNAGPSVGMGLHQDELVEFNNCTFIREDEDDYGGDLGAFYCHLGGTQGLTNQNLILKNCTMLNKMSSEGIHYGMCLTGSQSSGTYLIQNCNCKNPQGEYYIENGWTKDRMSFGNNPNGLDA